MTAIPSVLSGPPRRLRPAILFGGLATLTAAAMIVSLGVGAVRVSPAQVVAIILDRTGLASGDGFTPTQSAVLWSIRLPRVLLGVLVGAGLGAAGAALQGIFRNPLADPQLIGVSSGAAFGSAVGILALGSMARDVAGPLGAFVGGLAAVSVVYGLARFRGRTEVVTLILSGIAVAAIAGAGAALLSVILRDPRLGSALFYSLGSLGVATWRLLWVTAPMVLLAVALLPLFARRLDLVLLGEREASHMGVDVERLRVRVLALATVAVAATVAAAGVIGFVGLLAPHGVRLLAGPSHRVVLPASALAGALLVVVADAGARTIALPLEIPVGLLTAMVGGPVFLWLLRRTRREHGGWG
jgi:iron complex transport system permease protein